mmetsp:Transcript_3946/g.10871  ORF Transcript_3946/g.10871 Transcript_3946/m.10871 type:complete len:234 (-) Transcript_3946:2506-3207(-)
MTPVSPRRARASTSSSSHCLCIALSSFCFSHRNFCRACPACFVRFARAAWYSFSAASAACFSPVSDSFPSVISVVLMLPCPAKSAKPTSACFKAPTSLPPSPHIRTPLPRFCNSRITVALPCGVIRAKTRSLVRSAQSSGRTWTAASSASPVVISTKDLASSATSVESGRRSPRCFPVATTHSVVGTLASATLSSEGLSAVLRSKPGMLPSTMLHIRAMCKAVKGESPVSMAT